MSEQHYEGCWKDRRHHTCAMRRIARLEDEMVEADEYLPEATGPYQTLGERANLLKGQLDYALETVVALRRAVDEREHENAALKAKACRFYRADGTFEELPSPAEVMERRIECAKLIDTLKAKESPGCSKCGGRDVISDGPTTFACQHCSDLKIIEELEAKVARLEAPVREWLLQPDKQGWWWHFTGKDYLSSFMYMHRVMFSEKKGEYFLSYPDSRWCREVGGFWLFVDYPNSPSRQDQVLITARAAEPGKEQHNAE